MSELILVRHGQASFGSADYDQLSTLGEQQVQALVQHWQSLGERFDVIYSGRLRRQQQTAALLAELAVAAPQIHSGFDEYDGDPLIRSYLRNHGEAEGFDVDPAVALADARGFQRVLEATVRRWIADELQPAPDDVGFEAWGGFQQRIHRAVEGLIQQHTRDKRVLIATSAGVIALILQWVLRLDNSQAIGMSWMINNSSITRVRYTDGRISLAQFNALPHLEHPARHQMITWR